MPDPKLGRIAAGRRSLARSRYILAFVLGLAMMQALTAVASAAFPGRNGRLLLTMADVESADETFEGGVYNYVSAIDAQGHPARTFNRRVRRICYEFCGSGSYSPDGSSWATVLRSWETDRSRILVISADGSHRRFLTRGDDAEVTDPVWSADGRWVAFTRRRYGARAASIYVVSQSGGKPRRLAGGWTPAWSVRNEIAFSRSDGLYVMSADGRGQRRVKALTCKDQTCRRRRVAWSPDGRWLAFSDDGNIAAINAGGRVRLLTRGATRTRMDWAPAWSPDGRLVAFGRFKPSYLYEDGLIPAGIYVVSSKGGHARRLAGTRTLATLTPGPGEQDLTALDWQPLRR